MEGYKGESGKVFPHSGKNKGNLAPPPFFSLYKYTLMVCSVPHLSPVSASKYV